VQAGEENEWVLDLPGYDDADYTEFNEKLISGEYMLNVSAACFVYTSLIRTFEKVIEDLNEMVYMGKGMSFSITRKFVVDFYMLEFADYVLYSAFMAPKEDIYYQSRKSDDWKLLDSITTRHEIRNSSKYQW